MTGLARQLLALGVPGDLDRVRDVLWTCTAAELYDLLVTRRGWTAQAYGDFVLGTLRAALLAAVTGAGGAACRNRTDDLLITSEMLYRLS